MGHRLPTSDVNIQSSRVRDAEPNCLSQFPHLQNMHNNSTYFRVAVKIKCVHKALITVPGTKNILNKLLDFIIIQRILLGKNTAREDMVNEYSKI